jgi:hypothetical protein
MLFAPLGMHRTWYVVPADPALSRDVAPPYRCGPGGCEPRTVVWSHLYPIGLAFSTASDMARFMIAMLGKPELMRQQFTHDPWLPGIGTNFFLHSLRGHRIVSHSGGTPGAAALLALVPDEQLGIFIATNAGEAGFTNKMFRAIVDSILPDRSEPAPVSTGPVSGYEGSYLLTRYSHRTVERFIGIFGFAVGAWAHGDTLLINVGLQPRRFVRVDSLKLREVGGDGRAVLTRDARGRISMLYTGLVAGGSEVPGAFERLPWYEAPYFLNEYASWLVGAPILVWILWIIVAVVRLIRRRLRHEPPQSGTNRPALRAIALAFIHTTIACLFMFGFVAAMGRDISRGSGVMFGMTTGKLLLLRLAWIIGMLALPVTWYAYTAWRRQWWSWFGRLSYSVLALGSVLTAHFLVWWNYIPGRW